MADETPVEPTEEVPVTAAVIKRGELRPGDLVVLSYPHSLTDLVYRRLRETAERTFGEGIKVIILEGGVTIDSILSRRGE